MRQRLPHRANLDLYAPTASAMRQLIGRRGVRSERLR
jgi:hypothetical protein